MAGDDARADASAILDYLDQYEHRSLLRILTCGSVDDGKSTLLGRLLHDANLVYEDQLEEVRRDSLTMGTTGTAADLALLLDGLRAEREQGITIDVAYRYCSTPRRKFIFADTPGHEQYTRNMVTGASTAQLAIILVDARLGVLTQTRRHTALAALLGIGHVVFAVNKMDLVEWSRSRFEAIVSDCHDLVRRLAPTPQAWCAPVCALTGEGVVERGTSMPWFTGMPLLEYLETVEVPAASPDGPFRLPVQLVSRPSHAFRGYQGSIAGGSVAVGDEIVALPSGHRTRVQRIVTFDGDLDRAFAGQAVTVTLADQLDVSRGDVLVGPEDPPLQGHEFEATLVWMDAAELSPGKAYLLQLTNRVVPATVTRVLHRLDVATLEAVDASTLDLNDVGRVVVSCSELVCVDRYDENRATGAFILIDRLTNATVGAGMIRGSVSTWDVSPDEHLAAPRGQITGAEREARHGQRPCTLLLTGLTGAGKSTIATALERRLFDRGRVAVRLDGEDLRLGMSRDLGFSAADRSENLRRCAEVARLSNEAGLIVVAAFTAPSATVRARVRDLVGAERFLEIHVHASIETCRARDAASLYRDAESGDIADFPGVSAPYDVPRDPSLRLDTDSMSVDACVDAIMTLLSERGFLVADAGGRRG